ncbi:MAG: VanW family protein [Polyangiaceae bacterium]|nr:VanW family protein [Polyangiaceae bacterium]
MGLVAAAAAVANGWLFWPRTIPPPPKPAPVRLVVAGSALPMKGDPVAEALDLVRRFAGRELVLELPDGATRSLRLAELGAEIHRVRLSDFVRAALDESTPLRRSYERARATDPAAGLAVPVPVVLDPERALATLLRIKDEVDRDAADAVVDLELRKLNKERYGYRLDIYATLARIEAALGRGEGKVAAAVSEVTPRVVSATLGDIEFDDVLGYFETRYSLGAKYRARTDNLRVAASRLDGTVLRPGEIFDFNATVGPRDEAHGYKVAPVIAQGELVDGIGGGTCQISGTLHGAAFFAGLDIVEHYPHTRPSYYIKLGLDATVVYPTINFRFRNPFDFPIVLHETVKTDDAQKVGVVRAEILGPKRRRTVTFFRRLDEVLPFTELERETDKLPEGTRLLVQRGIPGFRATVFRVVRDGAYAVRSRQQSTYPPTNQIVDVGTGPKDLEVKRKDDAHPEYVADAYLVITQGPDIRTPGATGPELGGGTVESRVPGTTGRPGWQEKAGMPVYGLGATAEGDAPQAEGRSLSGAPDGAADEPKKADPPAADGGKDDGKKKKKGK